MGNYTMTVEMEGYGTRTFNVTVAAGETNTLSDVTMVPDESEDTQMALPLTLLLLALVGVVTFFAFRGKKK